MKITLTSQDIEDILAKFGEKFVKHDQEYVTRVIFDRTSDGVYGEIHIGQYKLATPEQAAAGFQKIHDMLAKQE